MDPVSLVFSAYLNTLQSTVSNHFNETRNLEVRPVVVEYEGVPVSYQHQLWRAKTGTDLFFRAFDIENVLVSYCHLEEITLSDQVAQLLVPVVHGGE